MSDIRIIGKPKSKAVNRLIKLVPFQKYTKKCDIILNYGLAGIQFNNFLQQYPSARNKKFINKYCGCNKYVSIKEAENVNINVPKTFIKLAPKYNPNDFIVKKLHSYGGIGIHISKTRRNIKGCYYQEFLHNRKFELRVHAFTWIDKDKWTIQKRIGNKDVIAWNYRNGGKFQYIHYSNKYKVFCKSIEISEKILKIRKMSFGAIDFIVTNNMEVYFLEINSAPGFTKFSENIYVNAFSDLKKLPAKKLNKLLQ